LLFAMQGGGLLQKQKKQVEPAFVGWNEWTRTTDPHLIRKVYVFKWVYTNTFECA